MAHWEDIKVMFHVKHKIIRMNYKFKFALNGGSAIYYIIRETIIVNFRSWIRLGNGKKGSETRQKC